MSKVLPIFNSVATAGSALTTSNRAAARNAAVYDAVIGSAAQVTSGAATHSVVSDAINAAPSQGQILILRGTYIVNWSTNKPLKIVGQGSGTIIQGSFTLAAGSSYSTVEGIRITGAIAVASDGNVFRNCFQATGQSITDTGAANSLLIIQE